MPRHQVLMLDISKSNVVVAVLLQPLHKNRNVAPQRLWLEAMCAYRDPQLANKTSSPYLERPTGNSRDNQSCIKEYGSYFPSITCHTHHDKESPAGLTHSFTTGPLKQTCSGHAAALRPAGDRFGKVPASWAFGRAHFRVVYAVSLGSYVTM